MITLYKATKDNKGSLLSINFVAKTDKSEGDSKIKGDKSFYFNFVAQNGYNEKTENGIFSGGKKLTVKFTPTEIGGIIEAIRNNVTLAATMTQEYVYHDGGEYGVNIAFEPHFRKEKRGNEWVTVGNQSGFVLRVVKTNKANKEDKESAKFVFTPAEARLVELYLLDGLGHIFNALYSEDIAKFKDSSKFKSANQARTSNTRSDSKLNDDDSF